MRKIAFGLVLLVAACGGADRGATPNHSSLLSPLSLVQKAIAARIDMCLEMGLTEANCKCLAETSANVLSTRDFLDESEIKLQGDHRNMDKFLRRKYADDPKSMFRLGRALQNCPASILKIAIPS